MKLRANILYGIALAAILSACSSESTINEVEDISGSTDPLRFTIVKESEAQMPGTRASQPLTSGFMVSCYKNYAEANQQVVMSKYEVRYHVTGDAWNGRTYSYWTYDDVKGQFLRFWDYSAFPYRFNAIAPYPANPASFTLNDRSLRIPTPYSAQTCLNGMVTPADDVAEPHLVAQVQRNTDGTDHDLLANDPAKTEINNSSVTKSRDVWMPFHHLNSKIRFGVYHSTQWLTANKTYIEDLTVSVTSPRFATTATGYQATADSGESWRILTGNSGFTGVKTVPSSSSAGYEIFHFDGGEDIEGNDLTECQTRQTAYWLQCRDGIMQIPQENVQMTVSFNLMNADGSLKHSFTNVPVRLELDTDPVTYQYTFNWQSGYIYTYYLVIGETDQKLEITFTATLAPWEDVTGSLTTNLEK